MPNLGLISYGNPPPAPDFSRIKKQAEGGTPALTLRREHASRAQRSIKAVEVRGVSIRLACQAFDISETCYRYQAKLSDENAEVAGWLLRLTHNQRNWGFGLCFLYLQNV